MAILGESFKPWVINQINKRQEKLSSLNKDNDLLKYLTSNTAFIRLTSGVNVDENILFGYELPTNLADSNLASQYVLEAARFKNPNSTLPEDPTFTSGVKYDSIYSSYGFLSNSNYGYVPPPGITQMDVKTLNRGTIREATIQLICHNIQQFYVINILFLKLKYSLLLEWGHTVYYDNKGELVTGYDVPNLSAEFLKGKTSQTELLRKIEEQREKSCGNYDAFFGWIKNFQWEAQENGSYNITLNAISTGDVIESLKLNANLNPNSNIQTNDDKNDKVKDKYEKSTFHQILGSIRKNENLVKKYYLDGFKTNNDDDNALNTFSLAKMTGKKINYYEAEFDTDKVASEGNKILADKEAIRADFPKLQTTQDKKGKNIQSSQYYIKLGAILRIIESFLLFYDTTKTDSESSSAFPPIFKLNHDYDENECLTTINQLPVDPRVALIPIAGVDTNTGPMKYVSSKYRTGKAYIAKTMHIYVNIDYIITTLDNNMDDKGNISILDFLNAMLSGVSNALGSINNFEISYDDATNAFSIIDNALVPIKHQAEPPEMALFNINAFTPEISKGGSFVTNFSLKSDIYSSIGNAVALSAQGGSDASSTAFSGFNSGIVDRYLTAKGNANYEPIDTSSLEAWEKTKTQFTSFAQKLTSTQPKSALTPEDIDTNVNYVVDVLQRDLDSAVKTDQIVGTVFIPLNFSLTLKGLSGLRQYQVFRISENILPKEYYNRVKFITTVIEHKVDASKGWETTINTIGIPHKTGAKYNDKPINLINPNENANNALPNALGLTPQQLTGATNNS
jgi:hypothetical protein